MNAHTPFDANQDWSNPSGQNTSNDPLVDALIGNAYHVVRTVYDNLGNLGELKRIYDFLNRYGMVICARSEAELKALPTQTSFARIYDKSPAGDRRITEYLYVGDDRTGLIPDDTTKTGSWIKIASYDSMWDVLTNKQAVARKFGVSTDDVVIYSAGVGLSGFRVIFDESTQRAYSLPAEIPDGTVAISLDEQAILIHSTGNVDLGLLAQQRGEFVTLPGTFATGAVLNTRNELLTWGSTQYRWDGDLPKVVPAGSTPNSTGDHWVGVGIGDAALQTALASNSGANYVGVATSEGNLGQLLSADDMAIKYGHINETVSGKLAKHGASVVLVGDSLTTPFIIDSVNTTSTFESYLRRKVVEYNPTAKFYNRGIGGARYYELAKSTSNMATPNDNYPWYSDISKRWLAYVEDVKPDVIFIALGMNDGNGWDAGAFQQPFFFSLMDELRSISSKPEIVFCTCTLPSNVNPATSSEAMQRGRDAIAGWVRSFALKTGSSMMDFHRRFKCLRDGVDPCLASYARKTINRAVTLPYEHPTDCEVYSATITLDDPAVATTGLVFNLSSYATNILSLKYVEGTGRWTTTVYTGTNNSVGISIMENLPGPEPMSGTQIFFTMNGDIVTIMVGVNTVPVFSAPVVRFGGKFTPKISGTGSIILNFIQGTLVPVKSELTDYDIYNTDGDGGNGLNHPTARATSRIYGRVIDYWFNLLLKAPPTPNDSVNIDFVNGKVTVQNPYSPSLNGEVKVDSALTFIEGSLNYSRDSTGRVIGAVFGASNRAYINQSLFNAHTSGYKKLRIEVEFVAPSSQAYLVTLGENLTSDGVTLQVNNELRPRVTAISSGVTSDLFGSQRFPYVSGRTYKLIHELDCLNGVAKIYSPENFMRGNIKTTTISSITSDALSKIKFGYVSTGDFGTDVVISNLKISFTN